MPTAQSAQQTLRLLDKNWKSFFKSIKDWSKHKEKYTGRPKLPNYLPKNGRYSLILTNMNCKLKDNQIHFPKCFNGFVLNTKVTKALDANTIIIGNNKDWKRESKMSKKVNQTFVGIPHQDFINKIIYKAENVGIKVILVEESYTSGASFLDNESPTKENYNKSRRIHRGLFKSNNGTLINADLNGAYQIMKKVFPNVFSEGIEGVRLHPIRVNVA